MSRAAQSQQPPEEAGPGVSAHPPLAAATQVVCFAGNPHSLCLCPPHNPPTASEQAAVGILRLLHHYGRGQPRGRDQPALQHRFEGPKTKQPLVTRSPGSGPPLTPASCPPAPGPVSSPAVQAVSCVPVSVSSPPCPGLASSSRWGNPTLPVRPGCRDTQERCVRRAPGGTLQPVRCRVPYGTIHLHAEAVPAPGGGRAQAWSTRSRWPPSGPCRQPYPVPSSTSSPSCSSEPGWLGASAIGLVLGGSGCVCTVALGASSLAGRPHPQLVSLPPSGCRLRSEHWALGSGVF